MMVSTCFILSGSAIKISQHYLLLPTSEMIHRNIFTIDSRRISGSAGHAWPDSPPQERYRVKEVYMIWSQRKGRGSAGSHYWKWEVGIDTHLLRGRWSDPRIIVGIAAELVTERLRLPQDVPYGRRHVPELHSRNPRPRPPSPSSFSHRLWEALSVFLSGNIVLPPRRVSASVYHPTPLKTAPRPETDTTVCSVIVRRKQAAGWIGFDSRVEAEWWSWRHRSTLELRKGKKWADHAERCQLIIYTQYRSLGGACYGRSPH